MGLYVVKGSVRSPGSVVKAAIIVSRAIDWLAERAGLGSFSKVKMLVR